MEGYAVQKVNLISVTADLNFLKIHSGVYIFLAYFKKCCMPLSLETKSLFHHRISFFKRLGSPALTLQNESDSVPT